MPRDSMDPFWTPTLMYVGKVSQKRTAIKLVADRKNVQSVYPISIFKMPSTFLAEDMTVDKMGNPKLYLREVTRFRSE